jgi:DNA-binding CsgD family transcriptional regulator
VAGHGLDRRALETALELEDPHGGATTFFRASAVEAMISSCTGDLGRAQVQMRAVQRQMLDGGTEVDIIWAAVHVAAIDIWSGRYAEATQAAQEALERAEQMGGKFALVTAWTPQAAVAAYTGREADARAAAHAAIDTGYEIGAPQMAKEPRSTLAFLEVSLGNYPAAIVVLQPDLDVFDGMGTEIEGGRQLPDAIEALTALGRAGEAEPLVEALERNGIRHDRPWMLSMGARGRGHMLAARGDLDEAQRAVEHAMTHHQRLPMPFETARTQLLLGQLQRRRRRRQDAAASLRAAVETFERLGTPLWAARARAELARLESPRGDSHGLTAAEQRIAGLAATGRSNKEIAAELFIAEKTVEMNLSRVYRKLGIRSRGGLSAALNREIRDSSAPA